MEGPAAGFLFRPAVNRLYARSFAMVINTRVINCRTRHEPTQDKANYAFYDEL